MQLLVVLHDWGKFRGRQVHSRVIIGEELVIPGSASQLSQLTALVEESVLRGSGSRATIELRRDVNFVLMTSSVWLSLQVTLH